MTALLCIDTESRRLRRYIPTVHAGQRGVYCTDEFEMAGELTDQIDVELRSVLKGKEPPPVDRTPPTRRTA